MENVVCDTTASLLELVSLSWTRSKSSIVKLCHQAMKIHANTEAQFDGHGLETSIGWSDY